MFQRGGHDHVKAGIEIYVSLILITIMALLCANFIAADIATMNARDAQSAYVTEIENADFADSVIDKCIDNAAQNGYTLVVNPVQIGSTRMAEVTLTYTYRVPLIGVESDHTITGYAK